MKSSEQHICDTNYQGSAQKHLLKTIMSISSMDEKKGLTSLIDKIWILLWDLFEGWSKQMVSPQESRNKNNRKQADKNDNRHGDAFPEQGAISNSLRRKTYPGPRYLCK